MTMGDQRGVDPRFEQRVDDLEDETQCGCQRLACEDAPTAPPPVQSDFIDQQPAEGSSVFHRRASGPENRPISTATTTAIATATVAPCGVRRVDAPNSPPPPMGQRKYCTQHLAHAGVAPHIGALAAVGVGSRIIASSSANSGDELLRSVRPRRS